MSTAHAAVWAAPLLSAALLGAGVYATAVIDAATARRVAGAGPSGSVLLEPFRRASVVAVQEPSATERPDVITWMLAPALYLALAAAGLAVIPWSPTFAIADVRAGIVVWGTVESLVVVAIFLHGWSANSHQPLLAAYRFLAAGLSYLLLSMFVLIAAAVPAQSLAVSDIVASQHGLWNVVRQPLGLPLFLIVALGSATWGPLDLADGEDLAGGTTAEVSGMPLLVWRAARAAMLTSFAAMAATVFLGGWQGPWLPGPVWVAAKTLLVLTVLVAAGHRFARVRAERF
ncbi:MAG: NADH-quinone oxidoreductase subunit H, partial [Acidimicrobiales bacterium]